MVSGINPYNNIEQSIFQPQNYERQLSKADVQEPSNSFTDEDQAIISAEAMLLGEIEKFNSGGSDALDLALAGIKAKTTVQAEVNVINAKKHMFDTILDMGGK